MSVSYGQPGPGARSLADMVIGHVDRAAPYVTDSDRADALALAFVDVAERVYPGGLAKGCTTGVDFEREGVMVRVVALEVPPEPAPREPVADPISDDELDELAAECAACPFDYASDAPEARVWRNLHRAVNELRAARGLTSGASR